MTAPSPSYADELRGFLAEIRGRLLRRASAWWGALAAAAVIAVAILAPLLALVTGTGRPILWAAALVAVAAPAAWIAFGLVAPARRWKKNAAVAREIGAHAPPIASDLLSSVELSLDCEGQASRAGAPGLIDALVADTAARARDLDPAAIVSRRPLRRPALAALITTALAAGTALGAPRTLARGYQQLFTAPRHTPFDGASVTPSPVVADIVITLTPPAYTGRPERVIHSSSGDFSAMAGARARVRATALEPAAAASLILGNGEDPEVLPMTVDGRSLAAELIIEEQTVYRFLVEDKAGDRKVEGNPHTITIDTDQKPKIQLFAPARDLDVRGRKRIELAYIAEDDHGIDKIELVWEQAGESERKLVPLGVTGRKSAQAKFLWDLGEVTIPAGEAVAYHLEVTDNDTVSGPKIGVSETYYLRILSPRDRHEQVIERQVRAFERMVRLLGGRLVIAAGDIGAHEVLNRETRSLAAELSGIVAEMGTDSLSPKKLATLLEQMSGRLEKLADAEHELLISADVRARRKGEIPARIVRRLARSDGDHVGELEDDVITLIDWIDRQKMELLLSISDDIQAHRDHVAELFKKYERTRSPEVLAEIQRELMQIERKLAELAEHEQRMPADVLDRFVNVEAMVDEDQTDCLAEVRKLIAAGEVKAAKRRMTECEEALSGATQALESALGDLRAGKFPREQKAFGEVMNELLDLGERQRRIAGETDEIWKRYAETAREAMRDQAGATREAVSGLVDKLAAEIDAVPQASLTPFSRDELAVAGRRVKDVRAMLAEGDIAEALAMARHAEASLEIVAAELAATAEQSGEPWKSRAERALEKVAAAQATAAELVEKLASSTPTPKDIMSPEDRQRLGELSAEQRAVRKNAERLARRAEKMAGDLPGRVGPQVKSQLDAIGDTMRQAEKSMQRRDPAGARARAREAAEALGRASEAARDAARRRVESGRAGLADETVRIPGADEYKPPTTLREDLLKAMNKEEAPEGYAEIVKRYYEELIE